jgi:hypothetical protein
MANRSWLKPTVSVRQAIFSELTDRYYSLPVARPGHGRGGPGHRRYIFDDFPDVGLDDDATEGVVSRVGPAAPRAPQLPPGGRRRRASSARAGPNQRASMPPTREHVSSQPLRRVHPARRRWRRGGRPSRSRLVPGAGARQGLLHFENDLYYLQLDGLSLNLRLSAAGCAAPTAGASTRRCSPTPALPASARSSTRTRLPRCAHRLLPASGAARLRPAHPGALRPGRRRALGPAHRPARRERVQQGRGVRASLPGHPDRGQVADRRPELHDDDGGRHRHRRAVRRRAAQRPAARRQLPAAGRTRGRRGRSIASVITYAHGTSHDAHFFDHPEQIISGEVRPPIVYVENQQVLERHIHAYLVQRFFHERVPPDPTSYDLFGSLGRSSSSSRMPTPARCLQAGGVARRTRHALQAELTGWVPRLQLRPQRARSPRSSRRSRDPSRAPRSGSATYCPIAEYAARETARRTSSGRRWSAGSRSRSWRRSSAMRCSRATPSPPTSSVLGLEGPRLRRGPGEAVLRLRAAARPPARADRVRAGPQPHDRQVALRVGGAVLPYQPTPEHTPATSPVHACSDCSWASMDEAMAQAPLVPRLRQRAAHAHCLHHARRLRARPQRQARRSIAARPSATQDDRPRAARAARPAGRMDRRAL